MATPDGQNTPSQNSTPPVPSTPQGPTPQPGVGSDSFAGIPAYADQPDDHGSFEREEEHVPQFNDQKPLFGGSKNRSLDGIGVDPKKQRGLMGRNRAGNITEKTGKAMKRTGDVAQGVGATAQAAGKTAKVAGQGAELAGKGMDAAGQGMQKGGQAMMRAGAALSETGLGAIVGVPLAALGGLTSGAGVATQAGGKMAQAGGKAAQRAGDAADKAGKKTRQAGKNFKEQGKKVEQKGKDIKNKVADKAAKSATDKAAKSNPVTGAISDLKTLMMGPRPSDTEIVSLLGRLIEYAADAVGLEIEPGTVDKIIKIAKTAQLFTKGDEHRIAVAAWPEEDKRFNPTHVSVPGLLNAMRIFQIRLYIITILAVLLTLLVAFLLLLMMVAAFCQFGPVYYASKAVNAVSGAASTVGLKSVSSFIDSYNFCTPINDAIANGLGGTSTTKTASGTPQIAGVFTEAGGQCSVLAVGPASSAHLHNTCFGGNSGEASGIARQESGGDPTSVSIVRVCMDDGQPFAVGLFHLDLTKTTLMDSQTGKALNCPAAFIRSTPFENIDASSGDIKYSCRVVDQSLYEQCVAAAKNPEINIKAACAVSDNGTNWSAWPSNQVCNF